LDLTLNPKTCITGRRRRRRRSRRRRRRRRRMLNIQ
jgi:hypothetical protein